MSVDSHEDSRQSLKSIQAQYPDDLALILLQDKDHKVIDRYGLLYTTSGGGLPHPATYIIDPDGFIRWRFVEANYRTRPTNLQIRDALNKLK